MTAATILSIVFNFVTRGDHTYKAIWMLNIDGHLELWVKDGDDHNIFAVVVIMTECIVAHILKAITYYHLFLKIYTCGTIQGCATIKINYENKVICTWIVTHWATIRIRTTNRVNMVYNALHIKKLLDEKNFYSSGIPTHVSSVNSCCAITCTKTQNHYIESITGHKKLDNFKKLVI